MKLTEIPPLLCSELSDREQMLWQLLREREELIKELKDEIAPLKGVLEGPKSNKRRLEPSKKSSQEEEENNHEATQKQEKKQGAGSAKRLINKLIPFTEAQRQAVETVQDQIWQLYQDAQAYKNLTPEQQKQPKMALEETFDLIFTYSTVFDPLNQVLGRLWKRKAEFLKVLERPDSILLG